VPHVGAFIHRHLQCESNGLDHTAMLELQEEPVAAGAGQGGTEADRGTRGRGVGGVDVQKGEIALTQRD
jgi:hypothetical protein